MIVDLDRFLREERPHWDELEGQLRRLAEQVEYRMGLEETRRFYYLYRRAASDLSRLAGSAAAPEVVSYLDDLVGRAYAEIHETRDRAHNFRPIEWTFRTFPQAFRRRRAAFRTAVLVTLIGSLLGGFFVWRDPGDKRDILPFPHLMQDPSDRVAKEESAGEDRLHGHKASFAATLMQNNIRVSIFAMALGVTFGFGTLVVLLSNGVILGAVAFDYLQAGEGAFLFGWLLPHGAIEIPAILIAGQAGLVIAHALLGWGSSETLRQRLRRNGPDVVSLIFGCALLLIWAGLVEAFFSQYHEPTIPYALKIAFGAIELLLLFLYLNLSGRRSPKSPRETQRV